MKKSILIAVLGVATSVASSFGQGIVTFSSYTANNGAGALTQLFGTITPITGFKVDLYYFLGTIADPVNNSSSASVASLPTGMIDLGVAGVTYTTPGYFDGPNVTIPGYTSGAVTFEVVAYNGATYDSSLIRGRSGAFTMNSISPGGAVPTPVLGDTGSGFPDFFVAPVPEPTTMALVGLGGLALVAFRRKQS